MLISIASHSQIHKTFRCLAFSNRLKVELNDFSSSLVSNTFSVIYRILKHIQNSHNWYLPPKNALLRPPTLTKICFLNSLCDCAIVGVHLTWRFYIINEILACEERMTNLNFHFGMISIIMARYIIIIILRARFGCCIIIWICILMTWKVQV